MLRRFNWYQILEFTPSRNRVRFATRRVQIRMK